MTIALQRLSHEELISGYRVMRTIREFEERLHTEFAAGRIPGAVHLYAGQEAIAAGACAHLRDDDCVASTHRGHGHAIAKGCDVTAMMLEIFGRADGVCAGKGGSMHIADFDRGMLGANGVAAGGLPLVCGAGLSAKQLGTDRVAVAFVGDGGANQGSFAESLCLAAVWQLPCIFVVEDNGYAQTTGTAYHLRGIPVARRAESFGIPAAVVDGADYFAVHEAVGEAVRRARAGGGPSLVECKAPRFFGHMEGFDQQRYRGPDEVETVRARQDCLHRFAERALAEGLTEADLAAVDEQARAAVEAAVVAAQNAADPDPEQLTADVYASH
jgi:acetoin:2,6-dichlorophenolindophenol oxidoreductase subunit alpha